jgi:hypothetical protein
VQQVKLRIGTCGGPRARSTSRCASISTRVLKTIAKYGLNTAAKKYEVDLEQFAR